jgi:hypothetical protein
MWTLASVYVIYLDLLSAVLLEDLLPYFSMRELVVLERFFFHVNGITRFLRNNVSSFLYDAGCYKVFVEMIYVFTNATFQRG